MRLLYQHLLNVYGRQAEEHVFHDEHEIWHHDGDGPK